MAIEKKIISQAVEDAVKKNDDTWMPGSLNIAIEQFQEKANALVSAQVTEMNVKAYITGLISEFNNNSLNEEAREKALSKITYVIKRESNQLDPEFKNELLQFAQNEEVLEIILLCGLDQVINSETEDPLGTLENAMQAYLLIKSDVADAIIADLTLQDADEYLENLFSNYEAIAEGHGIGESRVQKSNRIYGIYGNYLSHKDDEDGAVEKFERGIEHEDFDNYKFLWDLYDRTGASELSELSYTEGVRRHNALSVIGYFEYFKRSGEIKKAIQFLRSNIYIIQSQSTELFYYAVGQLHELIREEIINRRMLPSDDTLQLLIHLVHDVPRKWGQWYVMNKSEIAYYRAYVQRAIDQSSNLFEKLSYQYKGGYGLDIQDFQEDFWRTVYVTLFTKDPEEAALLKEFLQGTDEKHETDGFEEVSIPANLKNSLLDDECITLIQLELDKWTRAAAIGKIPMETIEIINPVAHALGYHGDIKEALRIFVDRVDQLKISEAGEEEWELESSRIAQELNDSLSQMSNVYSHGAKNWIQ